MSNNSEGDQAIAAINGHEVGGRALNVNEARPKGEGGGGGGRGGGGGNRSVAAVAVTAANPAVAGGRYLNLSV